MESITKYTVLKEIFGYEQFRPGQQEIVEALLAGKDVLGVMPTGAGKSLCYQIPALCMDGIALVISPLISLMKDQVTALTRSGVKAAYINSSLTFPQFRRVMDQMAEGSYKLIYVAPERLMNDGFLSVVKSLPISLVAVDEAHCVSQWGQDFRPGYLSIADFLEELSSRPVVGAFTATATAEVKRDIIRLLKLQNPMEQATGFDRPNLRFSVCKGVDRKEAVKDYILNHPDKSGIVYCATRKSVEEVTEALQTAGVPATRYHAGLSDQERKENQEAFLKDIHPVMVATNAFGMGIDKSNVSYVLHYNMPKNPESYYQEAGRAGRDGSKAECILFYAPVDLRTQRYFIENSEPPEEMTPEEQALFKEKEYQRLKYMTFYCSTDQCLRQYLLGYFGEHTQDNCGNCSNCDGGLVEKDQTVEAQKVLSCVARCKERFGIKMIIDVLRGMKGERLLANGFDRLSTYGIMKEWQAKPLQDFIQLLLQRDLIRTTGDEYPILTLTPRSWQVLKGEEKVIVKQQDIAFRVQISTTPKISSTDPLLIRLKAIRMELARRESVPAYIIFTDATLMDMCQKRPTSPKEFLDVSGVGHAKLERYGTAFLSAISEYL